MKTLRSGRRLAMAAFVAAALAPLSAKAQSRPAHDFTLAQVLSAPFPSGLTPTPSGGRVAWIYDDRGTRNVWAAERAPDGS